jgi:hypothetical protein
MSGLLRKLISVFLIAVTCAGAQDTLQTKQKNAKELLESSKNGHLREHARDVLASVWAKTSIYVCWENPSPKFQREMELVKQEVLQTWEHESQLRFTGWQKCAPENKGIRILIDDSGPRTQSLGQQLDGVPNGMILNFTFAKWGPFCQKTVDNCIKAMAGHQFGHAIGFVHEPNRPDAPGECWKTAGVVKALTPYDERSIMNYCIPDNGGMLSSLDIEAVQELYGSPITAAINAIVPASVQTRQRVTIEQLQSSPNGHLREHAYVLMESVWLKPPECEKTRECVKTSIYVCWENPSVQVQHEMKLVRQEVSETWERESQLLFTGWEKCATENKGIRILIDDADPHTKGLGRQLDGMPNGMVLNFTFMNRGQSCQKNPDSCIKTIAGHEFGHAIGFAHEQNRRDVPGECTEPPSGTYGSKTLTPYDEHSIMNYCNPKWSNGGELSPLDKDALHQLYGEPDAPSTNASHRPDERLHLWSTAFALKEEKRNLWSPY